MDQQNEEQIKTQAEEESGLDAGYADTQPSATAQQQGAESQPEPEPEPAPEPEPQPKPSAQPEPAPAGDELMKKISNLIDGRFRNFTGHVNKVLDERLKEAMPATAQAAAKAAQAQGGDAPSNQQIQAALKDGSKMKKLAEDFPEFGEALLEAQETAAAQLEKSLSEKFKPSQVDTSQFVQNSALSKVNETLVTIAHRSWKSDTKTPEFSAWLESQPAETKALADSDNPEDAIAMLDRYYETRNAASLQPASTGAKPSPKNRLAASAQPSTSGRALPQRVIDEDDGMAIGFNA